MNKKISKKKQIKILRDHLARIHRSLKKMDEAATTTRELNHKMVDGLVTRNSELRTTVAKLRAADADLRLTITRLREQNHKLVSAYIEQDDATPPLSVEERKASFDALKQRQYTTVYSMDQRAAARLMEGDTTPTACDRNKS